jgi:hypothetical protein
MVAEPAVVMEQFASDAELMLQVVVPLGETVREAGDADTFWTTPSLHVIDQGAVPVKVAEIMALPP